MKSRSVILLFVLIGVLLVTTQCSTPATTAAPATSTEGVSPTSAPATNTVAPAQSTSASTSAPAATNTTAPSATTAPAVSVTNTTAALDGQALVQTRCTVCHSLDRIQNAKHSADEWKATVQRMVGKGANLNDAEQQAVIDYLTKTYPK